MVSGSCSSSSFVQYIVFLSSERKSSIPLLMMQPVGEEQVGNMSLQGHRLEHSGSNTLLPKSTQAALLTCGARGENRAHEFLHLVLHLRPLGCSCGVARRCFLWPLVHPEVLVAPEQSKIPSLSVLSMVQSF